MAAHDVSPSSFGYHREKKVGPSTPARRALNWKRNAPLTVAQDDGAFLGTGAFAQDDGILKEILSEKGLNSLSGPPEWKAPPQGPARAAYCIRRTGDTSLVGRLPRMLFLA